jgi:hypothetical protein
MYMIMKLAHQEGTNRLLEPIASRLCHCRIFSNALRQCRPKVLLIEIKNRLDVSTVALIDNKGV